MIQPYLRLWGRITSCPTMLDPGRLGKRFPEYYQVMRFLTIPALSFCFFLAAATDTPPGTVQFRTHVIESNIPGGYSVIVADSHCHVIRPSVKNGR